MEIGDASWTVRRKWMTAPDVGTDSDGIVGAFLTVILLLALLVWPFWFAAKFLGVPWTIVVEQRSKEVGTERVRGWRASQRRIDEIRRGIGSGY